ADVALRPGAAAGGRRLRRPGAGRPGPEPDDLRRPRPRRPRPGRGRQGRLGLGARGGRGAGGGPGAGQAAARRRLQGGHGRPAEPGWLDRGTTMPGALVEPLFLTNPGEAALASGAAGQRRVAAALATGLESYLSGRP